MDTFLIPVDFSDVSYNAAQYAVDMAAELNVQKLIFYHSYKDTPIAPAPTASGQHPNHIAAMKHLHTMMHKLHRLDKLKDRILLLADNRSVREGVEAIVNSHQAAIIIMGIAGLSDIENTLIGQHTLAVAESGAAPLLIVPRNHQHRSIKSVVYASNLTAIETETPIAALVRLVAPLRAALHIVHVDYDLKLQSPTTLLGQKQLMWYLAELQPSFETVSDQKDIAAGINAYARRQQADLVVLSVGNTSFLKRLFHTGVRKKLLNLTSVPIVLLKKKNHERLYQYH